MLPELGQGLETKNGNGLTQRAQGKHRTRRVWRRDGESCWMARTSSGICASRRVGRAGQAPPLQS